MMCYLYFCEDFLKKSGLLVNFFVKDGYKVFLIMFWIICVFLRIFLVIEYVFIVVVFVKKLRINILKFLYKFDVIFVINIE